jgi:hypothetical protein
MRNEPSRVPRSPRERKFVTSIFLAAAALTALLTAFTHRYFGEKRLIEPLVASNAGVMSHLLAKRVIRFAWHSSSLLWVGQELPLLRAAVEPRSFDPTLIGCIGGLRVVVGVFDAIATRGRDIGWPLLTAIGVFASLALV